MSTTTRPTDVGESYFARVFSPIGVMCHAGRHEECRYEDCTCRCPLAGGHVEIRPS